MERDEAQVPTFRQTGEIIARNRPAWRMRKARQRRAARSGTLGFSTSPRPLLEPSREPSASHGTGNSKHSKHPPLGSGCVWEMHGLGLAGG